MEEDEEVALAVDTTIAQVLSRASGDGDASGIVLGGHFVQGPAPGEDGKTAALAIPTRLALRPRPSVEED
jgi:hypothetical protein